MFRMFRKLFSRKRECPNCGFIGSPREFKRVTMKKYTTTAGRKYANEPSGNTGATGGNTGNTGNTGSGNLGTAPTGGNVGVTGPSDNGSTGNTGGTGSTGA